MYIIGDMQHGLVTKKSRVEKLTRAQQGAHLAHDMAVPTGINEVLQLLPTATKLINVQLIFFCTRAVICIF